MKEQATKIKDKTFATLEKALGIADSLSTEEIPDLPENEDQEEITFEAAVEFKEGVGQEISTQDVLDDFMFVRQTMHHVIMEGQKALAAVMNAGAVTAHPRAFEVASTIMSNITDSAKSLLDLQEKMYDLQEKNKELAKQENPETETSETGHPKAVITGTTAEIIRAIRENETKDA